MTRNSAADDPRQVVADLERQLGEAVAQQAALGEVLQIINASHGDLKPVLDVIVTKAAALCDATGGGLYLVEGEMTLNIGGSTGNTPFELSGVPLASILGPNPLDRPFVHVVDLTATKAYRNGTPFVVAGVDSGLRSWLGVPVTSDETIVAVFALFREEVRAFTDNQITLLQSFAAQASIAIKNARLFNEAKEALEQRAATAEILTVINSSPGDLAPVFEIILEKAHGLCDVTIGSLELIDGDFVRTAAQRGGNEPWRRWLGQGFRIPEAFAPVYRSLHPSQVADMREIAAQFPDEFLPRAVVEIGGLRTLLAVPLVREGKVFGRIVAARDEVRPFTDKQIALLKSFADQAVIAIENARLFNETREALERQTATADILKVISGSPTNVEPVFQAIAERARLLCGAQVGATTRLDGDMVHLAGVRSVTTGAEDAMRSSFPMPLKTASPNIRRAIIEQKPIQVPDVDLDPDYVQLAARAQRMGFRSIMSVPLMHEGRSIGTIGVAREKPGLFPAAAVSLLQMFADQAVIAIENARLFNETKEALERQTATAEILKVIASSPSDLQPVFEAIAERSNRLVDALSTTVFTLADGMMDLRAFTPTTPEADATLHAAFPAPLSTFSWGESIRRGEIYRVVDSEHEPEGLRDLARLRGWRSCLCVPLLRDGKPIGMIGPTRAEPGPFTDHHVQLLQTFADQAVIAIQNTRLFNETAEALERQTATADVLKIIAASPTDVQPTFEAIVQTAVRLLRCETSFIQRCDSGSFWSVARCGREGLLSVYNPEATPIDPDANFPSRAIRAKKTLYLPDWSEIDLPPFERRIQQARGFNCAVYLPLLHEDECLGVLGIAGSKPHMFSEADITLAEAFRDQAVIAIRNTQLFEQVQQRTRELSQSLDDLRSAQDRLVQTEKLASLGQLTAGIAHEIKNPLNFVNNFAALSAELVDELDETLAPAPLDQKTRGEVGELTQMLKSNLEKVVQHGKRADSIVKNMLLHSREGSGEQRAVNINALLDEALNLAYHGARAEKPGFNVTLQRDFDPAAGMVELFPQEITRVFLNLVSNGFYASTKRKGDPGDSFEPTLRATTKGFGDSVEIRVRDNGIGIPPDVKEKIFNPFFTTKPAGEGTGLGLSMSHDIIVKQHGGAIDVATEPGEFTEFIVMLPRAHNPAQKIKH